MQGMCSFFRRMAPTPETLPQCMELLSVNGEICLLPLFLLVCTVNGDLPSYIVILSFIAIGLLFYGVTRCTENENDNDDGNVAAPAGYGSCSV